MLHELFLALSGHGSFLFNTLEKAKTSEAINHTNSTEFPTKSNDTMEDCISENNFSWSTSNFTAGNIIGSSSHFHPCEIKIISEILQVAGCYRKILNFYESVVTNCVLVPNSVKEIDSRNGHYLTAFATAIYEETRSYQKKVVQLESECLENPHFLLSTILLNVTPFYCVFIELSQLIDVVKREKLHGCKILDYLHKQVILSVGEIQEFFKRIKYSVQKVLIEQLTHWLLYGELLDPHKELFLKVTRKVEKENISLPLKGSSEEKNKSSSAVEVSLEVEMLPNFIPLSAAEKILFIGESILCFEKEGTRGKGDLSSRSGVILKRKEKELLRRFEAISLEDTFSLTEFLDLIETVRLCVAQHLFTLVIEAGLASELNHFKDIFLLGRGELYQAFFILSENRRPSITNINALFQRAGRQVMMEESLLDKFTVTYEEPHSISDKTNVWKNLRIDYKMEWPLHKFFNSKVQSKYNAILRFLLDIRQSQLRLQYLWLSQKENKTFKCDNLDLLCWTLRHHMSLFIYNIQYYIQVDVLESRFSELKEEIDTVKDYQHLRFQHQSFLSSITTQCFLSHSLISSSIFFILEKVNLFCSLLEAPPTPHLRSQIESVKEDFDRASAKFFWALNTLGQGRNCQHTSQLVMRIDYNKFYTRKTSTLTFLENV